MTAARAHSNVMSEPCCQNPLIAFDPVVMNKLGVCGVCTKVMQGGRRDANRSKGNKSRPLSPKRPQDRKSVSCVVTMMDISCVRVQFQHKQHQHTHQVNRNSLLKSKEHQWGSACNQTCDGKSRLIGSPNLTPLRAREFQAALGAEKIQLVDTELKTKQTWERRT